jgi:rSAM/selenodomain-associated transferase 1
MDSADAGLVLAGLVVTSAINTSAINTSAINTSAINTKAISADDIYTGRHRRDGALTGPGAAGAGKPDASAWSRAGRLLPAQIVVIAKEPVPGRVKTRLTPPFTPREAAALAEASLTDTLAAVADTTVARRVLALAGTPGRWLPPGFDVIGQRGAGLDERIAWALSDTRVTLPLPVVLIGMDTPQVTPALLAAAIEPLVSRTADATFGMAEDGGFWLLGLREVDPALILGVPMSQSDTGSRQLARLEQAGLRVRMLPELTDVDTIAEAERVAAVTPGSRFAACMARLRNGAEQAVAAAL